MVKLRGYVKNCIGKYKVLERKGRDVARLVNQLVDPLMTPIVRYNARFEGEDFCSELEFAAFSGLSLEGASTVLLMRGAGAPSSDQTMRYYQMPELADVLRLKTSLLTKTRKVARRRRMFRGPCVLAIDPHDSPYWGDPNDRGVRGTRNRHGTSWCHSFICADVVGAEQSFTINFLPRGPFNQNLKLVKRLVQSASKTVEIGLLLMDREFFSVDIVQFLLDEELNFIIPAVDTKEVRRLKQEHRREIPCVIDYTMQSGKRKACAKLALVERENGDGERKMYGFITNLNWSAESIADAYSQRWGIETDHRTREEFSVLTSSKSYEFRVLLFLLQVILRNIWALANLDTIPGEPPLRIYAMKECLRARIAEQDTGPP